MKSRWSDSEFRSVVDGYVRAGLNPDLATRVYTTRLLGGDPQLVLHGGGNTSVKTVMSDADGSEVAVICVKGAAGTWARSSRPACLRSGWPSSPRSPASTRCRTWRWFASNAAS